MTAEQPEETTTFFREESPSSLPAPANAKVSIMPSASSIVGSINSEYVERMTTQRSLVIDSIPALAPADEEQKGIRNAQGQVEKGCQTTSDLPQHQCEVSRIRNAVSTGNPQSLCIQVTCQPLSPGRKEHQSVGPKLQILAAELQAQNASPSSLPLASPRMRPASRTLSPPTERHRAIVPKVHILEAEMQAGPSASSAAPLNSSCIRSASRSLSPAREGHRSVVPKLRLLASQIQSREQASKLPCGIPSNSCGTPPRRQESAAWLVRSSPQDAAPKASLQRHPSPRSPLREIHPCMVQQSASNLSVLHSAHSQSQHKAKALSAASCMSSSPTGSQVMDFRRDQHKMSRGAHRGKESVPRQRSPRAAASPAGRRTNLSPQSARSLVQEASVNWSLASKAKDLIQDSESQTHVVPRSPQLSSRVPTPLKYRFGKMSL